MAVKMTGAQYKAFLASEWGPDAMWEETEIHRNGEPMDEERDSDPGAFDDADTVEILAGTIIPDQSVPSSRMETIDAVKFARKWLKAQTTVTLMVDVPREHADWFADSFSRTGIDTQMAKVVGRIG